MSNNPRWKRKLQDAIDRHNRQHATKPKGVSHKTMHERATSLFRAFRLLRRLGYEVDPENLRGRHVTILVHYWTRNPCLAELCQRRGVPMLEHAYSAAYLQQQLSFLRVYAERWIGKPGMVRTLGHYVSDPARFRRAYSAERDRSWEGNAVDFERVVDTVAAIDARVAAQLGMLLAFGLRRKEAVMFVPRSAIVDGERCGSPLPAGERYVALLRVKRGTKGGRLRLVSVRTDAQRVALDRALAFAPHASSHLGHPDLSLAQSLKRFDNVLRKAGVTRAVLGVTAHGLRHQFAQDFHVALTGLDAPIRGGETCDDPRLLAEALQKIAHELGHNRPAITRAYLGTPVRSSIASGLDKEAP